MGRLLAVILILSLAAAHVLSLGKAAEAGKLAKRSDVTEFVIPAPILKITSLEFDGLVSDFLFLESMVFLGSTMERTERPRVKAGEWGWFYNMLDASTDLDPYFLDPYYFANANLTWDAGMIEATNHLLEKGMKHRDWDSLLPFFIGFNYFYFLQQDEFASFYLMEASKRPGANPMYASLAMKLAYKQRRTENALSFIEELLKSTEDEVLKKDFEKRRDILQSILILEYAVDSYKKKFGEKPRNLEALLERGIINEFPNDPYGGEFYLDNEGLVKTTSDSLLMPHKK